MIGDAGGLRLPRLERLLGCRVGEMTADVISELVARRTQEDLTLDFKQALYAPGDTGAEELAKDVAAFANAVGGAIIVGVAEDGIAATSAKPVPITDDERRRMIDVLVKRVSPLLPDLLVAMLPVADPTRGFYLVAVGPSPVAPHGVSNGHRMSWPVREDTQTRWMREPELAARYRARFAGFDARRQVLEQVWAEGVANLVRGVDGWLALAAAPDRPGVLATDGAALDQAANWLVEAQSELPHTALASANRAVGRRRLLFGDGEHGRASLDWRLELHADGTGFAALRVAEPRLVRPQTPQAAVVAHVVDVESWSLSLLGLLARHAARSGAGGDLSVRAQLLAVDAAAAPQLWRSPEGTSVSAGGIAMELEEDFTLPPGLTFGNRTVPGSRAVRAPTLVDTTTSMSVASSAADLVAAAAEVAGDLLAEFGVPQATTLRRDGTVSRHAGRGGELLGAWAARHGIAAES